ncbi:MAG: hypothetical protein LBH90_06095 [Tannerella sp.]|nr:hypothetical protein [Tannerella sp.]
MNKVTFGGTFGAQFGSRIEDYTMITVAPQIGYNITNYLNAGAGISYSFYREKYYTGECREDLCLGKNRVTDKSHYAGFNIYGRLYLLNYITIHAQPEINYMTRTVANPASSQHNDKIEKVIPSFLIGAGVRLGPVVAMLQYDLVQDTYSPYGTRIFYSIGFSF